MMKLAKTYREVLGFEKSSKSGGGMMISIPRRGCREPNSRIERRPSPEYAALFDDNDNIVVQLFDYLYFDLRQVQTPAVRAFIEPFGKCFDRDKGHIGSELDKIGDMWGTTPDALFEAALLALKTDIISMQNDKKGGETFESILSECENSFFGYIGDNMENPPSVLMSQVIQAEKACLEEIEELKEKLLEAEETAKKLYQIKSKTSLLMVIEPLVIPSSPPPSPSLSSASPSPSSSLGKRRYYQS